MHQTTSQTMCHRCAMNIEADVDKDASESIELPTHKRNTSGAGRRVFAMCRASTWQSNLRENMSAPCHHELGTQRVDHNNIGNQNVIHIEAKNNSMKEITAHENNHQQTCLSNTERKPNKAQTQTNLTKNSGTNKLHHTRKKVQRDAQHQVRNGLWLRKYPAVSHNNQPKTECNNRQDRNDGAP